MKFKILAIFSVFLAFGVLDSSCSKGSKKDKPSVATSPAPDTSPGAVGGANPLGAGSSKAAATLLDNAQQDINAAKALLGAGGVGQAGGGTTQPSQPSVAPTTVKKEDPLIQK